MQVDPERFRQLERVFHKAAALPEGERGAFLDGACAGDAWLRREVDALLASDAGAETHLAGVVQGAAAVLDAEQRKGDIGRQIGPYTLVREIGRGGMGVVYQAVRSDGEFIQSVAIKLVLHGMGTGHIVQRFRAERQILATLQHPNIAALTDGGTTADGRPYLVMEYIEGKPLLAWCKEKEAPQQRRLEMFRAICAAVQHAHERQVIHRDIKPGNVLVTEDGIPKLLDFGVAKILNPGLLPGGQPVTRSGFRILTPDYASPEQLRGAAVTAASDIYCLGRLLRELMGNSAGMAGEVIEKAMRVHPGERYASAREMSEEIGKLLRGEPAAGRRRWLVAAAMAGAVAMAGIGAMVRRAPPAAEPADPEARSLYIRAHDLLRQEPNVRETPEGIPANFAAALGLLEEATRRAPHYAAAWSLLGQAYEFTADADARNEAAWLRKAAEAARKAIAVNREQADAYALLAAMAFYRERDLPVAERHYKRSIDLDPHNSHTMREYADLLRITGRAEQARTEVERAIALAPNDARLRVQRALLFYDVGRCGEAMGEARLALAERPGLAEALWLTGLCQEREGRFAEAELAFREVLSRSAADGRCLPALGHLYGSMGRNEEARRVLGELEGLRRKGKKVQYAMALVHMGMGDVAAALYWLHEAYAAQDHSIVYVGVEYRLRGLRGEAGFLEILRNLRLAR
ncbi:MAG: protein kinase [Bryobacterales bacterium]|nr:protein kinase [Bryobacterales bacterium]